MDPVSIFIAYSHNDLRYKDELKKFLRPLLNTGQATVWDDYDIEAGEDWEAEIKTRLYGSDIILLLVSPDSLASDYFYGREVAVSLERHEKGEAVVAPVILRPCAWTITPLKRIEALPEKGKPITSWPSQDEAFTDVAHRLGDIVTRIRDDKQALTQRDADRRRYEAAVEAAGQLFQKNNWTEAQKAYAAALEQYRPGFAPDAATLRQRLDECEQAGQQGVERQVMEERNDAASALLADANELFFRRQWSEALAAYSEAAQLLPEIGFSPDFKVVQERMSACETALQQAEAEQERERQQDSQYAGYIGETEKNLRRRAYAQAAASAGQALQLRPGDPQALQLKQQAESALAASHVPPTGTTPGAQNRWLWSGVGAAAVLLALFLLWRQCRPRENPNDRQLPSRETTTPPKGNAAQQDFQAARTKNTIPALTDFIKRFPNDPHTAEARRLLDGLEKNRTAWTVTAELNLEDRDFAKARQSFQKVLDIDPENSNARQKLRLIESRQRTTD
jgi:tetratricopeptide (TPR) repeat protein